MTVIARLVADGYVIVATEGEPEIVFNGVGPGKGASNVVLTAFPARGEYADAAIVHRFPERAIAKLVESHGGSWTIRDVGDVPRLRVDRDQHSASIEITRAGGPNVSLVVDRDRWTSFLCLLQGGVQNAEVFS